MKLSAIAKTYARRVERGSIFLEDVPAKILDEVKAVLGLTENSEESQTGETT